MIEKILTVSNKYRITGAKGRPFYIGRPSPLGNPYAISQDGTREEVIEMYRTWFYEQLENPDNESFHRALANIKTKLKKGHRVKLECFCAPKPCHGDVIREYFINLFDRGKE